MKQRTETLPSGATGLTLSGDPAGDTAGATGNAVGMLPFQVEFMKNLIDESLDEFRYRQLILQYFEYYTIFT